MKNLPLGVLCLLLMFISCQKQLDPVNGPNPNPNPNPNSTPTACSGTKKYLVTKDGGSTLGKDSFAYDSQNRMTYAKFNSSGRVATPAYANFTYDANGRITRSVVKDVSNDALLYTYGFTYRTDNKLDSIYSIGTPDDNYKLVYSTAGKLTKIIEYNMPSNTSDFYVVITTDANNNITKAVTWFLGAEFDNLSYTYDDKNNPLAGYAFFFAGLDDIEDLVTNYGSSNYLTQSAIINYGGTVITVVTGEKYDYNGCYPAKDYAMVNGIVIFPNSPDFIYTYK